MSLVPGMKLQLRGLPNQEMPPRQIAKLFSERRKELGKQAQSLPKEFSAEVERLFSNSKGLRGKLKGLGTKVPNSTQIAEVFGKKALLSDDALENLVLESSTQWSKVKRKDAFSPTQKAAHLSKVAELLAAHDVFLASRIRAGLQTRIVQDCEHTESFPDEIKAPSIWGKIKGAALFTIGFTGAFLGFMSFFDVPMRTRVIATAIAFISSAIAGAKAAAGRFSYEKAEMHFKLKRVSGKIAELDEMRGHLALVVGAMNVIQEDLAAAIDKLANAPETSGPKMNKGDSEA
ncbi:hypothetical protein JW721_03700 [Candidatus Micrarchaeota archaeon]|nr:hypothetical protein [Candidatus Micrarchaeota archaeon]